MNVAEYIVKQLAVSGITHVFGYQGGNITYVIDAISRMQGIDYVQVYHEQAAAFAANAYAQVSQRYGVAISSSGPGAINLINGIANAYFDSIPCVFITGNINIAAMRESNRFRQNGFQEADIVGMVSGITKYAVTVYDADKIPEIWDEAMGKMWEGRPGPVLLDIPHNIQRAVLERPCETKMPDVRHEEKEKENDDVLSQIRDLLNGAKRPVILTGNGCRDVQTRALLASFLEKCPVPVVTSLCGKDCLSNLHPCFRGMIGSYGLPHSNKTLNEADFVLALGTRMDERQRALPVDQFLQNAVVVHVDVDPWELGHVKKDAIKCCETVKHFLTGFVRLDPFTPHSQWLAQTRQWMDDIPESSWIYGKNIAQKLNSLTENRRNATICVDVGNHQMAAAQAVCVGENAHYLNSAGLGSMGYALPAAIGAYYAAPEKEVICIAGDGGMMMNLQELQLLARENLPIKVVIVNNHGLGMIENYQKLAFEGRLYGSRWGYSAPDFALVANAFGMDYYPYDQWKEHTVNRPTMIEIEVQS